MGVMVDMVDIEKFRSDAKALRHAAQLMGQAAGEIAPIAGSSVKHAAGTISHAATQAIIKRKDLSEEQVKKVAVIAGVTGCIAILGLGAACIGHVVYHHRVVKEHRLAKRASNAARERQSRIEDTLTMAEAIYAASTFKNLYDSGEEAPSFSCLAAPGCYAVCAYEPDIENGDFSAYRDVYVGASENMLEAAYAQLKGEGNLYVKADVEYGQPLYVMFFPCEAYEIYSLRENLMEAFGAQESYNKATDAASLD